MKHGLQSTLATIALGLAMATRAHAQVDTSYAHKHLLTWQDAALAGAFTIATIAIHPFDKRVQDVMQSPERQKNRMFRNAAKGFREIAAPGAIIIGVGMYTAGRFANNDRLAQLGLHGTEALFIGEGIGTDNRHWASDVIMGAAIGTFAGTKVVRYYRMHPQNKLDKWLLNASVSPSDLGHISLSIIPLLR